MVRTFIWLKRLSNSLHVFDITIKSVFDFPFKVKTIIFSEWLFSSSASINISFSSVTKTLRFEPFTVRESINLHSDLIGTLILPLSWNLKIILH